MNVTLRSAFAYDADLVSLETGLDASEDVEPSRTVQSEKEEADINVIVKRFGITGILPVAAKMPSYEDFVDVFDFRSAMDSVLAAEDAFMSLPADIRKRFSNDPQLFLEFVEDPANLDALREMGLAEPGQEPAPAPGPAPGPDAG